MKLNSAVHRRTAVLAVVGALITLAFAAAPAPAPAKRWTPTAAVATETCEQAADGGKGPIDPNEVSASRTCFEVWMSAMSTWVTAMGSIVGPCSQTPSDGHKLAADSLDKAAKSGQADVASTKKAKLGYFRAEAEWYSDHGPKGSRAADREAIDNVVSSAGKLAFDLDGFWSQIRLIAAALRNDDCAGADSLVFHQLKNAELKSKDEFDGLKTALDKLPKPPKKKRKR